jgi:hypothetical protein
MYVALEVYVNICHSVLELEAVSNIMVLPECYSLGSTCTPSFQTQTSKMSFPTENGSRIAVFRDK